MKILIFQRKSPKTFKAEYYRQLGILYISVGKKTYVLSLGMPPFIGSNYIRKKKGLQILVLQTNKILRKPEQKLS